MLKTDEPCIESGAAGVVKAAEIIAALRTHHLPRLNWQAPSWVFFDEVRISPGWGAGAEQRIDAWAMNCWPSKRQMVAYEVKVSRSDFRLELRKPVKRKLALFYSNRFYFATPVGLINPAELPTECGLVEVQADGSIKTVVDAPWRDCHPPSWNFMASIARRVIKAETAAAK